MIEHTSKVIKVAISELPAGVKACPRAATFKHTKGLGEKGNYEIYSFFDEGGKLIKRNATYIKDNNVIQDISWYRQVKNTWIGDLDEFFPQRLKIRFVNGKAEISVRQTWLTDFTRLEENIRRGRDFDVHKIQSFSKWEKPKTIQYKTYWDGEKPVDFSCDSGKLKNKNGLEYLPLFVSPINPRRYKHLEKYNLKEQDLNGIVPETRVISRRQFLNECSFENELEKACNAKISGYTSPIDGEVTVVKDNDTVPTLINIYAHEYQHARDFSDAERLGGEAYNDMIEQGITEKNCGGFKIKISDFKFKSLKKKGPIYRNDKEYKRLSSIKWVEEHENYDDLCLKGQHDDAIIEKMPIKKGNSEENNFYKMLERIFNLFGGI